MSRPDVAGRHVLLPEPPALIEDERFVRGIAALIGLLTLVVLILMVVNG